MCIVRLVEHRLQITHVALHDEKAVLARSERAHTRRDNLGNCQMIETLGDYESFHYKNRIYKCMKNTVMWKFCGEAIRCLRSSSLPQLI